MSPALQWALVALGVLGASATWFRAWIAWREHLAAERERRRPRPTPSPYDPRSARR